MGVVDFFFTTKYRCMFFLVSQYVLDQAVYKVISVVHRDWNLYSSMPLKNYKKVVMSDLIRHLRFPNCLYINKIQYYIIISVLQMFEIQSFSKAFHQVFSIFTGLSYSQADVR